MYILIMLCNTELGGEIVSGENGGLMAVLLV